METTNKNSEIARKTKNFVKNVRRDVRGYKAVQDNPTSTKYEVRRALAEKVATNRVVTSVEKLLEGKPSDSVIAKGVEKVRTDLINNLAELGATKNNPDASQYKKRRARGEEVAIANALNRMEKLLA